MIRLSIALDAIQRRFFTLALGVASEPIISDYSTVMEISIIIDLFLLLAAAFYLHRSFGLIARFKEIGLFHKQ